MFFLFFNGVAFSTQNILIAQLLLMSNMQFLQGPSLISITKDISLITINCPRQIDNAPNIRVSINN